MSTAWEVRKLKELCTFFGDGDWIESKDQSQGGIRLIQTGNVGDGVFKDREERARYISASTFERLRCTEVFEGDCLISRLPDPVGRSCILPNTGERMITAVDCTIARFDRDLLLPEFFNFYSQSAGYLSDVDAVTTGTTRKRISRSNLGELKVPVPAIREQRRIVAILDKAFESIAIARACAEKNLQNARELIEALLAQVFALGREGWCERSLEQVVDEHCSLSYGIVQPGDDSPGGLPVVRSVDLTTKVIGLEGLKRVRKQVAESYQRTELRGGELLLCVRGTTGTVAMASPELKGANVTRGIVPVAFNRALLDPGFGYYLMSSALVQEQIRAKTYGAALMQINIRDLRAIRVVFPALSEQRAIRERLDRVLAEDQRLESIYRRKLAALDELKQSLLHQAFSGQL